MGGSTGEDNMVGNRVVGSRLVDSNKVGNRVGSLGDNTVHNILVDNREVGSILADSRKVGSILADSRADSILEAVGSLLADRWVGMDSI